MAGRAVKAIAIGKFDALHRGHRALIDAAAKAGRPVLLTFSGMAKELGWAERLPLVAPSDRARVIAEWSRELGVDIESAQMEFQQVRPLSPEAFVALLKDRLPAGVVVVGHDFRFGHGRAGGIDELRALASKAGIAVAVVEAVTHDGAVISSSRVRSDLEAGHCHAVTACLGRPHRVVAKVVRGDGRGRKLGFPTANCGALENQPPGAGVYAGRAWVAGKGPWPAAINAGTTPTVATDRPFALEAHLIGFDRDCYGERIELDLLARLRGERKFPDLDALRAQVTEDIRTAAQLVGNAK